MWSENWPTVLAVS